MYARHVGKRLDWLTGIVSPVYQNCWSLDEATHYWDVTTHSFQPLTAEHKQQIRNQNPLSLLALFSPNSNKSTDSP